MHTHFIPDIQLLDIVIAVVVAVVFIALMSLLRHPTRRTANAIVVAVAAGTYMNGGFGTIEFFFSILLGYVAFKGLESYRLIAFGWLLHTAWDILHHYTGHPMIATIPTSSLGCFITDPLLALWLFFGAPSLWEKMSVISPREA